MIRLAMYIFIVVNKLHKYINNINMLHPRWTILPVAPSSLHPVKELKWLTFSFFQKSSLIS